MDDWAAGGGDDRDPTATLTTLTALPRRVWRRRRGEVLDRHACGSAEGRAVDVALAGAAMVEQEAPLVLVQVLYHGLEVRVGGEFHAVVRQLRLRLLQCHCRCRCCGWLLLLLLLLLLGSAGWCGDGPPRDAGA